MRCRCGSCPAGGPSSWPRSDLSCTAGPTCAVLQRSTCHDCFLAFLCSNKMATSQMDPEGLEQRFFHTRCQKIASVPSANCQNFCSTIGPQSFRTTLICNRLSQSKFGFVQSCHSCKKSSFLDTAQEIYVRSGGPGGPVRPAPCPLPLQKVNAAPCTIRRCKLFQFLLFFSFFEIFLVWAPKVPPFFA